MSDATKPANVFPPSTIELEAAKATAPAPTVYIVSSKYGPEGIFSTPDRARDKVAELSRFAAYHGDPSLMVRPYVLDSE